MGKISVVIVDDQPIHLIILASYFDEDKYIVTSFEHEEDALNYAINNQPDIFIVDYFMTNYNGIELIEKIKKLRPNSKCILYTSESIDQNEYVDYIVHKPVVKETILNVISSIINKK